MNLVANALAQSADHIKSFFTVLRLELGFYVGCLNLHERLDAKGEPTCIPGAWHRRRARRCRAEGCTTLPVADGSSSAWSATTSTPTASRW